MLTAKQEKFCQSIIEGMSQADAYRTAYSAKRMSDKTIHEAASRLMRDGKISARVDELRSNLVNEKIMSAQERLELLTRIARGEEPEKIVQFVDGEPIELEAPASLKTRREAIDTMNKMTGEYVQKVVADVDTTFNITVELSDD
jgi:phage terminase small subunit